MITKSAAIAINKITMKMSKIKIILAILIKLLGSISTNCNNIHDHFNSLFKALTVTVYPVM